MLLETAKTEYVRVADIDFAYRRLGMKAGMPLVLMQHFTGTTDSWDPPVVNGLAADLLGYSLGGFVAQLVASKSQDLVGKLILVGTAPQGGEQHLMEVLQEAFSHKEAPDVRLPLRQCVRDVQAIEECAADSVPRFRTRRTVSVSGAICRP